MLSQHLPILNKQLVIQNKQLTTFKNDQLLGRRNEAADVRIGRFGSKR